MVAAPQPRRTRPQHSLHLQVNIPRRLFLLPQNRMRVPDLRSWVRPRKSKPKMLRLCRCSQQSDLPVHTHQLSWVQDLVRGNASSSSWEHQRTTLQMTNLWLLNSPEVPLSLGRPTKYLLPSSPPVHRQSPSPPPSSKPCLHWSKHNGKCQQAASVNHVMVRCEAFFGVSNSGGVGGLFFHPPNITVIINCVSVLHSCFSCLYKLCVIASSCWPAALLHAKHSNSIIGTRVGTKWLWERQSDRVDSAVRFCSSFLNWRLCGQFLTKKLRSIGL